MEPSEGGGRLRLLGGSRIWGGACDGRAFGFVEFLDLVEFLGGDHSGEFLAFGHELDRDAVDAVSGIFFGHLFAVEDVAEVTAAVFAGDFDAGSIGVGFSVD